MATEHQQDHDTSQQIMTSSWILTESHEFIKNALSYLPAIDLFRCARVCKQWEKTVAHLLKGREQLGWASYNHNSSPDRESHHALGFFGDNLKDCCKSLWSVPHYALMFTELVSRSDFTIGTKQTGSRRGSSKSADGKTQIAETVSLIKKELPQQCTLLSLLTRGTVGTYANMQLAGESEGDGGATALLLPRMQGVDIGLVKVNRKALSNSGGNDNIQDALGLTQTTDVKCVILFGVGISPTAQDVATKLQASFRETYGRDPVIAGAIAEKDLTKEEASSKVISLTFSGPNIQAASVILGSDVCTKTDIKQKLQKLKNASIADKKSVAFMFACVGRGINYYEEENAESTVFQKLFPDTPLFGFFGNGEIGCDNLSFSKLVVESEENKNDRLPNITHGYTSIFCLLSFTQAT